MVSPLKAQDAIIHMIEDLIKDPIFGVDQFRMTEEDAKLFEKKDDPVDHPAHYNQHPSGVEVIRITEHLNFCKGNVVKYVLRSGYKGDEIEDLRKAAWYLDREIKRLESLKRS
jgi:hypothetical protein